MHLMSSEPKTDIIKVRSRKHKCGYRVKKISYFVNKFIVNQTEWEEHFLTSKRWPETETPLDENSYSYTQHSGDQPQQKPSKAKSAIKIIAAGLIMFTIACAMIFAVEVLFNLFDSLIGG